MSQLAIVALASWLAGVAAFLGGLLARVAGPAKTEAQRELVHGIVAFGGGILLAAVALVLVPEGIGLLPPVVLALTFCIGGLAFCVLDAQVSKRGGTKAQSMAMLVDFLPEAISLGAVFGRNPRLGILIAAFIGAQNLPEGFNSFREIVAAGARPRGALMALLLVSLLGPTAACMGYLLLQDQAQLTAAIMSFAAGGILYLIFQDIAPESKMRRRWTPPLGAVLGFVVGMIGKQVVG